MKKTICTMLAVVLILTTCMIPSFAGYTHYHGANITVIRNGYNRDWEDDPRQPLAVVEISTSASIMHKAWAAIRLPGESWYEDAADNAGYTSYIYHTRIAYSYPNGLETDYGAVYP